MVIRYFWTVDDGRDLDTVTVVSKMIKKDGTTIEESTTNYPYITDGVGYGQGYVVSGVNGSYIEHAGDNTVNGNECVYLNFKNLTSEEALRQMLSDNIRKIRIELYGTWFGSRTNGMLDVSLYAYLGGTMGKDPNDNFNYVNTGGEEVYGSMEKAKVCATVQGSTSYSTTYTHIGYVEYDIETKSAILKLNEECAESTYALTTVSETAQHFTYENSTTHSIKLNSIKDGNFFSSVTFDESCEWIGGFTSNSTSNPMEFIYWTNENTTSDNRRCTVTATQSESGKKLIYTIVQQPNNATFFSLSETEEKREDNITLTGTNTTIHLTVLSCKNYKVENGNVTGNSLDYSHIINGCGTSDSKELSGVKYTHRFNIPVTCENGTITLTQAETNNQIIVSFTRTNSFELSVSEGIVEIEAPAVESYIVVKSKKNGQPYSAIMFSESCDWVTGYYLQSTSNGEYNYQFTTQPNTGQTQRECEITVSQNGGQTKTFIIKQKAAESNCMSISYVFSDMCQNSGALPIYFSTRNGTIQATHMPGTTNTTIELCDVAENTNLVVSTTNTAVTLSGDISFTYTKDDYKTIYVKGNCPSCYDLIVTLDRTLNRLKYEFSQITYTDITMQIEFYDNLNNIVGTYRNTMIPQGFINTDWLTLSFNTIDVTSMKVTQLIENQSVNTDGGPFTYELLCNGQATYLFDDSEIDNCSTIGISCSPKEVTSGGTEFLNNGVRTTITVTGGTTNKWSVISTPDGSNLTSNNTGTTYIGYKFGTYTIQSDECPEKTCTFKILEPEIKGIRIANNQPGTAKIYKTTVSTGKVLIGELSNRGQEQVFNVTFNDHGSLDIEYEPNQWCKGGGSCFVYVRVEGDNLMQIGNPTQNGVNVEGDMDGARISGEIDGSCSGGFTTASGYYTVMINVKYAGNPCNNC